MTVTGLVTGIKNKGDVNRVIEVISGESGIVYVLASGARRLSSRFMSLTNTYTLVSLECAKNGEMLALRDGTCLGGFENIISDTDKFVLAAEVVKNVKIAIQNSDNKGKLYSLLLIYMQVVDGLGAYEDDFDKIIGVTVKLYVYMLCYLGYDVEATAEAAANGGALADFCKKMSGRRVSDSMMDLSIDGNVVQAYNGIREIYSEQLDIDINSL